MHKPVDRGVFSAEPQPMVEKKFQITAAMGHSKGLSHRAFGVALRLGASCGQPVQWASWRLIP